MDKFIMSHYAYRGQLSDEGFLELARLLRRDLRKAFGRAELKVREAHDPDVTRFEDDDGIRVCLRFDLDRNLWVAWAETIVSGVFS